MATVAMATVAMATVAMATVGRSRQNCKKQARLERRAWLYCLSEEHAQLFETEIGAGEMGACGGQLNVSGSAVNQDRP